MYTRNKYSRAYFNLPASPSNAFMNGSIGACTTPAPTWPTPGFLCATPVSMTGVIFFAMTLVTSIPVGVPGKFSAGIWYILFSPKVISYMVML
jgi:hypothetical protein